jgi:tetratricopeptide (TPR) repeat protein
VRRPAHAGATASSERASHRPHWASALLAACAVALSVHLLASGDAEAGAAGAGAPQPPALWGEPVVRCPATAMGAALQLARSQAGLAHAARARRPFSVGGGVMAVPLYEEAAACFGVAAKPQEAASMRALAASLRSEVAAEFKAHRLRLHRAIRVEDWAAVRRQARVLRAFVRGRPGQYTSWLSSLERRATLTPRGNRVLVVPSWAAPALLLGSVACTPPASVHQARQAATVLRRERTAEKLVARGKLFAQTGDLVRAAQYLVAAISEGGSEAAVLPLLMQVYVRSGRYRVAINHGERYLAQHPGDHRMRFLVATLHAAVGDDAATAHHLERVLHEAPTHAPAHYALGVLLRDSRGDPAGADHHFREYIRLAPSGPHVEEARASLLQEVE